MNIEAPRQEAIDLILGMTDEELRYKVREVLG